MNTVIFYAANSNEEFHREAERMAKLYDCILMGVSCAEQEDRHSRREKIKNCLNNLKEITLVAFMCHGWKQGIQLGFDLTNIEFLASVLKGLGSPKIMLYCCGTAEGGVDGDGGFADRLRDLSGFTVNAHDGVGHTTRRPYVKRFEGGEARIGGDWIIAPNSDLWPKWYKALKGDGDFRFRYPMMSKEEIITYLQTQ